MSYLKEIANYINAALKSNIQCKDALYTDLVENYFRYQDEKIESYPAYVDGEGIEKYVGPDDDYSLMVYHRLVHITVGKANINKTYGNDQAYDGHIAKMSMVVFGKKTELGIGSDDLSIYMHAAMPEAATKEMLREMSFNACNINMKEIILSDMQVFKEEFTNVPFFLKPDQFMFKMNYTIESAFLKRCFNKCPC